MEFLIQGLAAFYFILCRGGLRQGRYWHDRPPIQYKRKSDNAGQGADLVLSEQRAALEGR